MKLKDGFLLREVAGEYVVVPVEQNLDLNCMITLNRSGVVLWNALQEGATAGKLAELLTEKYGISSQQASADVEIFLEKLKKNDFLL